MPGFVGGLCGCGAWGYFARCLLTPGGFSFSWPDFSGRLVLILKESSDLEDAADAVAALAPLFDGKRLPVPIFADDERTRLSSLELLRRGAPLALATPEALRLVVPTPAELSHRTVEFRNGLRLPMSRAIARLMGAGYRRVDFVETPGEFAVRGAILDFYGLEPMKAVRVLYDEDEVASLRAVDPMTQQTTEFLSEARALCAAELPAGAALSQWFADGWTWVAEEGAGEISAPEEHLFLGRSFLAESDFGARPNGPYVGGPARAWEEMKRLSGEGYRCVLFSLNAGEERHAREILEDEFRGSPPCQFLVGPLRRGFHHLGHRLAAFSVSEIFSRNYRPSLKWQRFSSSTRGALRLRELKPGDFVVHQDYGVARFKGLEPVASPGHGIVDCVALEFRGTDALYLPMAEFGKVQRYSGAEGKRPRLSSLDARRWGEVKEGVAEGVRELAGELLKIQAERAARPGFAFPAETAMERAMAAEFPYEETPDQARAIEETLADMTSSQAMDRLIVGDVGFGKTEVIPFLHSKGWDSKSG